MSLSDPIADMLTRIRNGVRVKKTRVDIRRSRLCLGIARILKRDGFIEDLKELEDDAQGHIRIYLKYGPDGEDTIRGIERVSKPGRRVYVGAKEVPRVRNGLGMVVLSTSKGVMCDRDAREASVGGEVICEVW